MKKIITLLVLLISIVASAQVKYPIIEKDSLGQEVIIMTTKQAMLLDNNSDLLKLYEQLGFNYDNYDSTTIKVINDQNEIITFIKMENKNLKDQLLVKDEKITILQNKILEYITKVKILEDQLSNRQEVIDKDAIYIKKLKKKALFGGIGGGIVITGLIIGILVK